MKKDGAYYAINKQEDEDGYTINSDDKTVDENLKNEEQTPDPDTTSNKQPAFARRRAGNLHRTQYQTLK
jgi:hypothetical protein